MAIEELTSLISDQTFGIWFLIGAALVFWMQAGFAMVETGFTRAKNAGNIIMKNLMDFCIGTVVFIVIGFSLLLGEDLLGFIGKPGFDIFTAYDNFNFSSFVFNLVFCATTATIVSGAMAERTKFLSYCVYSGVISALVYPIEAHWIWGGGWLAQLGFHDFAGSCCIHMVGGISAIIGAKILGPRIGKFVKDENGKVVKVNAFPGHSIPLGALGVFILWFGWYGFNGAACTTIEDLGSVFLTTTVSPAIATVTCMVFTWIKYGKPDVSMCLNASLAGLVAITASCDVTDAAGAVAVHMMNGIWGTIAVGLFATSKAPGYAIAIESGAIKAEGLFYGGGFTQLGLQLLGFVSVAAWAAVCMTIVFFVIKATIGLRATEEEEIKGLDICEHGLTSAYAGFELGTAGIPDITYEDIRKNMTVCDVVFNPPETKFLKEAKARGAATVNGLGMLVNQAALNYCLWTENMAPKDMMKEALLREFNLENETVQEEKTIQKNIAIQEKVTKGEENIMDEQDRKLIEKMMEYYAGDPKRVQHFLKVYEFAKLIGESESLDTETMHILRTAAIVHDIGIKISEEKYGSSNGKYQEKEGPAVAEPMLLALGYDEAVIDRVLFLIAHHHTYNEIEGLDYQILVEADFLVNLFEDGSSREAAQKVQKNIFKTNTGTKYLSDLFLN